MRRSVQVAAIASVAALGLGPLLAATAAATDTACSSGPWSSPAGSGTVSGCTTRVSQTTTNGDPNGTSQRPRISEDGNWVTFQSAAFNLVPNDNRAHGTDVFLVNRNDPAGTMRRISATPSGGDANGNSTFTDVSDGGNYVVFYSQATNLVAGKTTRSGSLFLWSRSTGACKEIVHSASGGSTNGYSTRPTISANGQYIAYTSKATNVVSGVTHPGEVYVTNTATGATALVSRTAAGGASNGFNAHAEISSDGSHIAWQSEATNLAAADRDSRSDIYESANPLANSGARPVLVSVSTAGGPGGAASVRPAVNGTGSVVVWESAARDLVAGDTNAVVDCFLRNMTTGRTIRVSVAYDGSQLTAASTRPNPDFAGDRVGFAGNAHNIVRGDTNGQRDVFVRDLTANRNYLVSVDKFGTFGGGACGAAAGSSPRAAAARAGGEDLASRSFLSADGLKVAFISGMCDLVPNDGNSASSLDDIFVRDFGAAGPTATGFPRPAGPPATAARTTGPTYVFSRGPNAAVYYETNAGSGWSSATSLGGTVQSAPGAAAGGNGSAEVFVRGTNNQLYSRRLVNNAWTPWAAAGGELSSGPAAAAWGSGRDDVFVRGSGPAQALYHRPLVNGIWGPWETLGGRLLGSPGASSWASGQLSVFVQGTDNQLWGRFYRSTTGWSGWTSYGGTLASGPAVVSVPDGLQPGHVNVFVTGGDGGLYQQTIIDGRRGTWVPLGGVLAGGPAASSTGPGHYRVVGASPNGHLYERVYNGGWGPWTSLP